MSGMMYPLLEMERWNAEEKKMAIDYFLWLQRQWKKALVGIMRNEEERTKWAAKFTVMLSDQEKKELELACLEVLK